MYMCICTYVYVYVCACCEDRRYRCLKRRVSQRIAVCWTSQVSDSIVCWRNQHYVSVILVWEDQKYQFLLGKLVSLFAEEIFGQVMQRCHFVYVGKPAAKLC